MVQTWLLFEEVLLGYPSGSRLARLMAEVLQNQIQAGPGEMPDDALFWEL